MEVSGLSRPFGTGQEASDSLRFGPIDAVPFWQIFPIAERETPLSLVTGESSIPVEGLIKPSPTSTWRLPPLSS
ncbi:MAG: hypothetical protein Q3997_02525 [Propionibacteriaceae bacterium]|nr:hypothetical protein [Propionibacteriaceae bacterium]